MSQTAAPSAFARLKDLAKETTSEKRRELLRGISDLFLANPTDRSETECMLFDDVVTSVVKDMEASVRAELSEQLCHTGAGINKTLRSFAMDDDIRVAGPVLKHSEVLTDDELIEVVAGKTQAHMLAITERERVSARVSDALVDRGSDAVVSSLLENSNAIIERTSMEKIADRAMTSPLLQSKCVSRDDMPLDLLNELTLVVQNDLRREILSRFENISVQELDAALARGRRAIRQSHGKATRQQKLAEEKINLLANSGRLKVDVLLKYLQEEDHAAFSEALGRLSGIGYQNATKIYRDRDIDSLALTLKALNAPLPLFATIAAYVAGVSNALDQVKQYASVYREVPPQAAQRAMRFWQVRTGSSEAA